MDEGVKPGKRQRCMCTTEERMWMEGVKPGKRQRCLCTTEEKNMDRRDYVKGGEKGGKTYCTFQKTIQPFVWTTCFTMNQ